MRHRGVLSRVSPGRIRQDGGRRSSATSPTANLAGDRWRARLTAAFSQSRHSGDPTRAFGAFVERSAWRCRPRSMNRPFRVRRSGCRRALVRRAPHRQRFSPGFRKIQAVLADAVYRLLNASELQGPVGESARPAVRPFEWRCADHSKSAMNAPSTISATTNHAAGIHIFAGVSPSSHAS